jgi:hypothetical protein
MQALQLLVRFVDAAVALTWALSECSPALFCT